MVIIRWFVGWLESITLRLMITLDAHKEDDLIGYEISCREYLFIIGHSEINNLSLSKFEKLGIEYWSYDLKDLDLCISNNIPVVLVRFKDDALRLCEV